MNRSIVAFLGLFLVLCTSCQFSENIYINEDGSGSMTFSMDASELMEMAGSMDEGNSGNGMDKAVDSTVVFKDFLIEKKDSIATLPKEDQDKLKALENFELHMVTDPQTNKMVFDISSKFENTSKINDLFDAMNSLGNLQGQGGISAGSSSNPFANMSSGGNTNVNYSFKNNVFRRTSKVIDTLIHRQTLDSIGEAAMVLEASNYKLNYYFKKPIKSVSNENATISEDRMSCTLEIGFMESFKHPEVLNIEVVLED